MELSQEKKERIDFLTKQIEENKKKIELLKNPKKTGIAVRMTYTLYFNDDEGEVDFGSSDTQFQILGSNDIEVSYIDPDGERQVASFGPTLTGQDLEDGHFETYTPSEFEEVIKHNC